MTRDGDSARLTGHALEAGVRLTRAEFERRYALCPHIKKAELIEGMVRMPSPVRYEVHGKPHAAILGPMLVYAAHTPGVGVADNTTVRLDPDNEPQPDVLLRIEVPALRQSVIDADGYVQGAPELVAEISAASALHGSTFPATGETPALPCASAVGEAPPAEGSYDLGDKLHAYARNGVREYIVWRTRERRIDWFELGRSPQARLREHAGGTIHSRVFPGLRIAVTALLEGDMANVLATVQEGVGSPEHRRFVARLGG